MSKFTTQVRWIVEQATPNFVGTWDARLTAAAPKIFNFPFPIWSEEYRVTLEKKILRHYFTREIGMETVGLWKFELETRLNEIMPYYNQLYETTQKEYNYLWDTDITEIFDGNENGKETANFSGHDTGNDTTEETSSAVTDGDKTLNTVETQHATGTVASTSVNSDFPQSPIADGDYASGSVKTDSTDTSDANNDTTTTEHSTSQGNSDLTRTFGTTRDKTSLNDVTRVNDKFHELVRRGTSGSRSMTELLEQYRKALLNIDMLVINELSDLFMLIY